jgi:hypothetical protein
MNASRRRLVFSAARVGCSEAIDWELVQVNFDTTDESFDEANRTTPYLLISARFEFSDRVEIEYHDGEDYAGDSVESIDLWRRRVLVASGQGHEFDIAIDLPDDAFTELREHLTAIMGSDCFCE